MVTKKKATSTRKKSTGRKGRTKTGGRKAGTPNKTNKQTSLLEYARKIGKAPAELLLDVANGIPFKDGNGETHKPTHAEMVQASKDVAPYVHPKLRSMEVKGEVIAGTLIIKNG